MPLVARFFQPRGFFGQVADVYFYAVEIAMKYKIALRKTEEGFSVCAPGLPGCWSQGTTEQEALANITDAIREYLAVVQEKLTDAEIREVDVAI